MIKIRHDTPRTICYVPTFSFIFVWLYTTCSLLLVVAVAFSETKTSRPHHNEQLKPTPSLHSTLQNSFTPFSIIENVAVFLTPEVDPSGALSSLTLVRLSKQLISLDNKRNDLYGNDTSMVEDIICNEEERKLWENGLKNSITCLTSSNWIESEQSLEALVEGTKSASVISRLLSKCQGSKNDGLNGNYCSWWNPLLEKVLEEDKNLAAMARPHQLSGLKWSIDCFRLSKSATDFSYELPQSLQHAYDDLDLPFTIRPGILTELSNTDKFSSKSGQTNEQNWFTVASFVEQVKFRTEKIQTKSNRVVIERRQTAWEGDDNVPSFQYSGKSMKRMPWSPIVANVRDRLRDETSQYYDGCLLNFYPDGGSGMRYHIDPDQGVQWGFETAVVSIGATRRFAFRSIHDNSDNKDGINDMKPHSFVLMHGDVTEMVRDCQKRFQHTVKTAEFKEEAAARVSLVFKKTLRKTKQ